MADELFPTFDVEEIENMEGEEEYVTEYKRSIRWDTALGDFARDNSNRLVQCEGQEAYAIWCFKIAQTERDSHMSYMENVADVDLGVEMDDISQEDDPGTVESMIERTITEALEVNPRTEFVGNFDFMWEGDNVHCKFEVKGVNWDETIKISI